MGFRRAAEVSATRRFRVLERGSRRRVITPNDAPAFRLFLVFALSRRFSRSTSAKIVYCDHQNRNRGRLTSVFSRFSLFQKPPSRVAGPRDNEPARLPNPKQRRAVVTRCIRHFEAAATTCVGYMSSDQGRLQD